MVFRRQQCRDHLTAIVAKNYHSITSETNHNNFATAPQQGFPFYPVYWHSQEFIGSVMNYDNIVIQSKSANIPHIYILSSQRNNENHAHIFSHQLPFLSIFLTSYVSTYLSFMNFFERGLVKIYCYINSSILLG